MKRTTIVILAILITLCFALSGCAGTPYSEGAFEWKEGEIKSVFIDIIERSVLVKVSNDDSTKIEYYKNAKEDYSFILDDGILTVKSKMDKEWYDFIGVGGAKEKRKIVLYLPQTKIDNFSIHTTNGNVTVDNLQLCSYLDVRVEGGDITVTNISVGKGIKLFSKNGNTNGTILGSYDEFTMKTSVKKGNNNLPEEKSGGDKTLDINVNNGNIMVEFVQE